MKEDHIIWSNGCVKIKEINKCGPYDYWSNSHAQKNKINERGLYYFVKWSCANKRNKLARTLSLD